MYKPFLVLQLRPEDAASDDEFAAICRFGGLDPAGTKRVRMEQGDLPGLSLDDYSGIIVGGGPFNVSDAEDVKPPVQRQFEAWLRNLLNEVIDRDFPYLGACYGLGILANHLGAPISKGQFAEGVGDVTIDLSSAAATDPLTRDIETSFLAFGGHKESCQEVPKGAVLLGSSANCPVHMLRYKQNIYATQFHTELDAAGLEIRINIYRHAGYFPPEEADTLIAANATTVIKEPMIILRRFIGRYQISA